MTLRFGRDTALDRYDERRRAWCKQYALAEARVTTGGAHCVLPVLGKRCQAFHRYWEPCSGCMPSSIGDHGRYFRHRGGRRFMFLGQPYNNPSAKDEALLDRVRAMGLFVHVGQRGEAWHNTGTFPIVISREMIPEHAYRCAPYDD